MASYSEKDKEKIIVQAEYIEFLETHVSSYGMFCALHGLITSEDDIKLGEELRAKIKELS